MFSGFSIISVVGIGPHSKPFLSDYCYFFMLQNTLTAVIYNDLNNDCIQYLFQVLIPAATPSRKYNV
jgi:hypothetical protein